MRKKIRFLYNPGESVKEHIYAAARRKKLLFCSFDPVSYTHSSLFGAVRAVCSAGADGVMLGGSTGVTPEIVSESSRVALDAMKDVFGEGPRIPLILFPSSAGSSLAEGADALWFLCLLNSRNVRFIVEEQAKAAPHLASLGLEPLSCGFIIVEPGMTAGKIGEADLIERSDPERAAALAVLAQTYGMSFVYLNAGSGAPAPPPAEMVGRAASALAIPLIAGGGVRFGEQAAELAAAGADILVAGCVFESANDAGQKAADLIRAISAVPARRSGR